MMLATVLLFAAAATTISQGGGCPSPPLPPGGHLQWEGEEAVRIVCDVGLHLVGDRELIRCVEGKWEHPFPKCTAGDVRPIFEWRKSTGSTGTVKRPMPRAAQFQNDKGDTYLRHMYYHNNYYYHNQHPPLSESQVAWIHSLPPELRDQYLRDLLYSGGRQYYYRQPVQTAPSFDYTCNRAGWPFVAAPRVARAHVTRYDRRQSAGGAPFLAAVYRCDPGYALATTSAPELYCSRRRWLGHAPRCLPANQRAIF